MENKILQMKQKPQAIILVENPLCNIDAFLKSYMKSIVSISQDCEWSKKIDNDSYFDLITINGYEETIKKEQILDLFQKCSVGGLESRGIKFYIIKGVEYATQQSVNSLLKMLEETPVNTYAILTTRALNLVLPTIRSRCQTFTLKSNLSLLSNITSQYNLTTDQISLIKNVYYSYDQLDSDLQSKFFFDLYDLAHAIKNNKSNLQVIKTIHGEFKKMDYKQIGSLLTFLEHMSHGNQTILEIIKNIKVNPIKTLVFNQIMEQFSR